MKIKTSNLSYAARRHAAPGCGRAIPSRSAPGAGRHTKASHCPCFGAIFDATGAGRHTKTSLHPIPYAIFRRYRPRPAYENKSSPNSLCLHAALQAPGMHTKASLRPCFGAVGLPTGQKNSTEMNIFNHFG